MYPNNVGKPSERPSRPQYIPGMIILRIAEDAVAPVFEGGMKFAASVANTLPEAVAGPLDFMHKNLGLKNVTAVFSRRQRQLSQASVTSSQRSRLAVATSVADSESEELRGFTVAALDPKAVTPSVMRRIRGFSTVTVAELMPTRWLAATAKADPLENRQWGLRAIKWFRAKRPSATEIRVGVMDTGIDENHPDFAGLSITYNRQGLKSQDVLGHGTHVSGIIAAVANNNVGISGVASCPLVMWKIFDDKPAPDGEFYVDGVRYLRALNEARNAGIRALNLSIGGTASSQTERLLFRRLEEAGVVCVAAMGNDYQRGNPIEYPAAYDTVFGVGSMAENNTRSAFSNTGKHIQLVAPGSNILSTLPMSGSPYLDETEYGSWSGTSMATPHVAAAAGLVAAAHPTWTATQVKAHLRKRTSRLGAMKGKPWTPSYGAGLLNLDKVLT